ncbi:hypothetical protein XCR1_1270007 [Xenorhabdus cabanillasii JM26]|uniref:Uncharacterized protein n=1 Tax=Xenorhabdus cabanillasii JM26 TaxID=1427517 RepID=W1IRM5_9GAMM|nr:hypothetical protein XCR1_1270007 [Xenorhabdus cabanillasii JM26]
MIDCASYRGTFPEVLISVVAQLLLYLHPELSLTALDFNNIYSPLNKNTIH